MAGALSNNPHWPAPPADLGHTYNTRRITVKNHGCCGHAFSAIDGALALQAEHDFAPSGVVSIEVGGYSGPVGVSRNGPHRPAGPAKCCPPFPGARPPLLVINRLDAYSA